MLVVIALSLVAFRSNVPILVAFEPLNLLIHVEILFASIGTYSYYMNVVRFTRLKVWVMI